MSENLQEKYDTYQTTIRGLAERLNSLNSQIQEHEVVIETLAAVPGDRKAWKMFSGGESSLESKNPVGSALVEMPASDAKSQLEIILKGLKELFEKTEVELKSLQAEFENWKKVKNIKIVKG